MYMPLRHTRMWRVVHRLNTQKTFALGKRLFCVIRFLCRLKQADPAVAEQHRPGRECRQGPRLPI